jgi:hypothetical protein
MFEKEAEEYYKDVTVGTFQECTENFADAVLTAYKDGAEFGYDKANEWHRDEVPENENDILCQVAKDEFVVGYYRSSKKHYYTTDGQDIDVIAWKEIIPPKQEK